MRFCIIPSLEEESIFWDGPHLYSDNPQIYAGSRNYYKAALLVNIVSGCCEQGSVGFKLKGDIIVTPAKFEFIFGAADYNAMTSVMQLYRWWSYNWTEPLLNSYISNAGGEPHVNNMQTRQKTLLRFSELRLGCASLDCNMEFKGQLLWVLGHNCPEGLPLTPPEFEDSEDDEVEEIPPGLDTSKEKQEWKCNDDWKLEGYLDDGCEKEGPYGHWQYNWAESAYLLLKQLMESPTTTFRPDYSEHVKVGDFVSVIAESINDIYLKPYTLYSNGELVIKVRVSRFEKLANGKYKQFDTTGETGTGTLALSTTTYTAYESIVAKAKKYLCICATKLGPDNDSTECPGMGKDDSGWEALWVSDWVNNKKKLSWGDYGDPDKRVVEVK
jgi:hypothetical protein